jgi:ATP-binding cassette subfamily B protein
MDGGRDWSDLWIGLRLIITGFLRYPRLVILSILAALVWMAVTVLNPYLQKLVVDQAIEAGDPDLLVPLVLILLLAGLMRAVSIGWRRWYAFKLAYRYEIDLRSEIFSTIQRLGFDFYDHSSAGALMARASTDLNQVRLVYMILPITLANIITVIMVVVMAFLLDPVMGFVAALTLPVMVIFAILYARKTTGISFQVQQALAEMGRLAQEGISGIAVTKSFGREEREARRARQVASDIFSKSMGLARFRSLYLPWFELIPTLVTLGALWLGGIRVANGDMTIGDLLAFTQYLVVLYFPIRMTGWFFAEFPRCSAAGARIVELLETAPSITGPDHPRTMQTGGGSIRFDGVSFAYNGQNVLQDLDLVIPAGSSVALFGATGCGKTTLAHLIPRFYDPQSGMVSIDGIDIRQLDMTDLRREVSVAFEEPFLFSATVAENIAFGAPDTDQSQIVAAARVADAHDFIQTLPEGYDTVVGERGLSLSGGQRQRLALARAIVGQPRILILDDATSAVDAITEAHIHAELIETMRGRTTIVIAHRTSTLLLADQIILLEDGKVVAFGEHQDLWDNVPRYRQLLADSSPLHR